jgi:hypothetical protein
VKGKTLKDIYIYFKDHNFKSLNSNGQSRGLIMGLNKSFNLLSFSIINVGLIKDLWSLELGRALCIINMYGLYDDIKLF